MQESTIRTSTESIYSCCQIKFL